MLFFSNWKSLLGAFLLIHFIAPVSVDAGNRGKTFKKGTVSNQKNTGSPQNSGGSRSSRFQTSDSGTREWQRPSMSSQQKDQVQKLQGDLSSLKSQSQVTQEQKDAFADSFRTLAEGTTKPSQESVQKLSNDLTNAMSDGKVTGKEQYALLQDVSAVLNSANIPQSELEAVIGDAKGILVSSGVSQEDVQLIVSDLRAIGSELKKNAATTSEEAQEKKQGIQTKFQGLKNRRPSGN